MRTPTRLQRTGHRHPGPCPRSVSPTRRQAAQVCVNDTTYPERKDAADPFAAPCRASYAALRDRPNWETKPVGAAINGIGITARRRHVDNTLLLTLDVPSAEITVKDSDLHASTPTLALGNNAAELNPAAKAPGLTRACPTPTHTDSCNNAKSAPAHARTPPNKPHSKLTRPGPTSASEPG